MLPSPPTPAALTASRAVLQAASLLPLTLIQGASLCTVAAGGTDIKWPHCFRKISMCQLRFDRCRRSCQKNNEARRPSRRYTLRQFFRAAAELGLLNFVGTALQAVGLESTSATKGAFLIQTTAIFTPLLASLSGGVVSGTVWVRQFRSLPLFPRLWAA